MEDTSPDSYDSHPTQNIGSTIGKWKLQPALPKKDVNKAINEIIRTPVRKQNSLEESSESDIQEDDDYQLPYRKTDTFFRRDALKTP